MYNLKYKTKNPKLVDTENRLVVTELGVGEWVKWAKGVKTYKLPVTKEVSHADVLMYTMVITVN